MALDFATVFVAVLCDDHSRSGAGRIFRFFGKDREKFCIFRQSTDVAWYFPVFIDLGMQQPLSGLFYSGDDTDGIGWIDTGVEAAGGMEGRKREREEQTGVFSRIEKHEK